jgi:hypothetical protein
MSGRSFEVLGIPCPAIVSHLTYSGSDGLTLMVKALWCFKMSGTTLQVTQCHISDVLNPAVVEGFSLLGCNVPVSEQLMMF